MILTTIDFLVGEETNIFLPGNKIGRMHTQHPRWNFKKFPAGWTKIGFWLLMLPLVTKVFQKTKVQQVKTPLPSCTICWVRNIIDTFRRIFFGDILGQRFVDFHNGIKCHKHPKCSKLNLKEPLNLIRINLCVHVPNEMTTTHSSTTAIWHIKSPYLSRSL